MYIRDGRAPIPKKEVTSRVMSAIRAKNTKPEIALRKALSSVGVKGYRLHPKNVIGKPDICFIHSKIAIFVNGCYWHRCPYCKPSFPKSHLKFWKEKFERNKKRDNIKNRRLRLEGWRICTVWECQIKKNIERVVFRVEKVLAGR